MKQFLILGILFYSLIESSEKTLAVRQKEGRERAFIYTKNNPLRFEYDIVFKEAILLRALIDIFNTFSPAALHDKKYSLKVFLGKYPIAINGNHLLLDSIAGNLYRNYDNTGFTVYAKQLLIILESAFHDTSLTASLSQHIEKKVRITSDIDERAKWIVIRRHADKLIKTVDSF